MFITRKPFMATQHSPTQSAAVSPLRWFDISPPPGATPEALHTSLRFCSATTRIRQQNGAFTVQVAAEDEVAAAQAQQSLFTAFYDWQLRQEIATSASQEVGALVNAIIHQALGK